MSRHLVTILAGAAVLAGNLLLWTMRPTAEPMTPEPNWTRVLGEIPEIAIDDAFVPVPLDPRKPLDLELQTPPPEDRLGRGDVLAALRDRPYLDLNLAPRDPMRPLLQRDPNLFFPYTGIRPAPPGYRLSDNLRLRGGIGSAGKPKTRDRDYAIGLGIDLSY